MNKLINYFYSTTLTFGIGLDGGDWNVVFLSFLLFWRSIYFLLTLFYCLWIFWYRLWILCQIILCLGSFFW